MYYTYIYIYTLICIYINRYYIYIHVYIHPLFLESEWDDQNARNPRRRSKTGVTCRMGKDVFLFSAERNMLTIWLFFVCVCGIQYDNIIWLYYVYMYIYRYRYVDSGVDRIWECPRIFTQIWNIWIHVWTCLNIHVLSTSGWWYNDYMMIPQDVDQSPGTLDIEIAGNSWMFMPTQHGTWQVEKHIPKNGINQLK
jgi:hypothetical protein